MKTALVCGSGGFVGTHLVRRLKSEGYWVRGVDLKYPEFSKSEADEFLIYDLRDPRNVESVMRLDQYLTFTYLSVAFQKHIAFDEVYQLAADMGGAGYIFTGEHDADVMNNSALINLNVAAWAKIYGVGKLFYSSSACMYPQELQTEDRFDSKNGWGKNSFSLRETDAYPANPDSEYGWEKLFSERLYLAYARNYNLNVRIARFHNVYGPFGSWNNGKEKAPAAMCRRVVESINWNKTTLIKDGNQTDLKGNQDNSGYFPPEIEVWGTGHQTRSFLYIDDCIDAVRLLMESDFKEPINIGSEEMVTINQLAQMAIDISGKSIKIKNIPGPTGVMGRNSCNDLIREKLNWEPKVKLRDGLERTFHWIKSQYGK